MSFPRYPSYKVSGVEWLGAVPGHWKKTALKFLAEYQNGFPFKPEDWGMEGLPIIRIAQLTGDGEPNFYSGTLDSRVLVETGDLLFSWSANIDSYIWEKGSAWLNQHIFKVTPSDEADKSFLFYVIKHVAPKLAEFDAHGSTMRHIKKESLGERVFVPPLPEQTQIATFLDRETAKIDALIAEQRRLMELLKEKRQAVISHAVTQGLNPDAPMKPSGIEWLGDVPAHWEVKPLKAVCELFGRIGYRGYTTADIVDEGEGAITLSPSNMADGVVSVEKSTYISWEKYSESPEIMIHPGDIVMVKTGSTFGKVAYVSEVSHPTTINPQLVLYKNITCESRFLFFILNAEHIRALINVNNTGSSIPTMTQEAIGNFRFGLPPEEEQGLIVEFIDAELVKLDTLTAEAQRAIDLLQERRTALISAAVTGQIDVRGIQVLPQ